MVRQRRKVKKSFKKPPLNTSFNQINEAGKIDQNFRVKKGITKDQIYQLIAYTKSDPQIQKFTGDLMRFRNKATFDSFAKGAIIYTLQNGEDLLGIFSVHPLEDGVGARLQDDVHGRTCVLAV